MASSLLSLRSFALRAAALWIALFCMGAGCADSDDPCPEGQERCEGRCVDPGSDPAHCGGCGESCGDETICVDGSCVAECPDDLTPCGSDCVDLQRDASHCGSCSTACTEEQLCAEGSCVAACEGELQNCDGECVNLSADDANCGACGESCGPDESCLDGSCQCEGALDRCGDGCVDFDEDPLHCGGCDRPCASDEACEAGVCVLECGTGLEVCKGSCVDTLSHERHCGECGVACARTEVSIDGSCRCPSGTVACGGSCVDVDENDAHCGECDNACDEGKSCREGACRCPEDSEECEGTCVDTSGDPEHCGACGNACALAPNALGGSTCEQGSCVFDCAPGWDDCTLGGGCETSVLADVENCGACGITCLPGEICVDGSCICREGAVLCGQSCIDVTEDFANCGDCGRTCRVDEICSDSDCVCPPGRSECDGACVHLPTDPSHCGACNEPCREDQLCAGSSCTCPSGQDECVEGACVDVLHNDQHCGTCDNDCDETRTCRDGSCVCKSPLTDCDGTCVPLHSDPTNCGTCGITCRDDQICDGSCRCPEGTVECDGECLAPELCPSGACGVCPTGCDEKGTCLEAVQVDGGVSHTCALNQAGEVWCWGDNAFGQLGDGNTGKPVGVAVQAQVPGKAVEIVVGDHHGCARLDDGSVACWGRGTRGQLGDGTSTDRPTPTLVPQLVDVLQITAGGSHTCALMKDQTVRCWGANDGGKLGAGVPGTDSPIPLPVRSDPRGGSLANVHFITASQSNTCAVVGPNRIATCWGQGGKGQNGNGRNLDQSSPLPVLDEKDQPITDIWKLFGGSGPHGNRMCAVDYGAVAFCWGQGDGGAIGDGREVDASRPVELQMVREGKVEALASGNYHGCGLTTDGLPFCWGLAEEGRLGTGAEKGVMLSPEMVLRDRCKEKLMEATSLGGGSDHGCAVTRRGEVLCWGRNDSFQVGDHPTSFVLCAEPIRP